MEHNFLESRMISGSLDAAMAMVRPLLLTLALFGLMLALVKSDVVPLALSTFRAANMSQSQWDAMAQEAVNMVG